MRNSTFLPAFAFLTILFMIFSCKKPQFSDLASTAWNPNLAIPLAYGTFDVFDIFANTDSSDLVVIDPNSGTIALVYKSDLDVLSGADLVSLQEINDGFVIDAAALNTVPMVAFNGTVNNTNQQDFQITTASGVEINNFTVKSGQLTLNLSTNLAHNVTVDITFPGVIVDGAPVQRTVYLSYSGNVPHSGSATINLANAEIDCSVGIGYNTIRADIVTIITGSGAPISGTESISVDIESSNIAFSKAYGYFGQQSILNLSDSILVRLFENSLGQGDFEFVNPSLTLIVENEIGIPVSIDINDLKAINAVTGQTFNLSGYATNYNINFPNIFGGMALTAIVFNTLNTANLNTIISPVPKYLSFLVSALTNPVGQTGTMNFVSDTSSLRLRSALELPLEGFAYGFGVRDTIPFNLTQNINEIEYVMFRLFFDNGFPVELGGQVKFMDDNYNVLFSAFDQTTTIVPPAMVNALGVVNQRATSVNDIVLEDWKLNLLPQVKYLEIEGNTQTTDGPLGVIVKMLDYYNLKMKLSMQIQVKMSF